MDHFSKREALTCDGLANNETHEQEGHDTGPQMSKIFNNQNEQNQNQRRFKDEDTKATPYKGAE